MHHSYCNKNCIILYIEKCGLGPFEKERPLVMKFKYSLGDCELSQVDFGRKAGKARPFDCERTRTVVSSWSTSCVSKDDRSQETFEIRPTCLQSVLRQSSK